MKRITHKDVEAACGRYNKAFGFEYNDIGYLRWADIRGDGNSKRGLWVTVNENGGVGGEYGMRGKTMRETIKLINIAIDMDGFPPYAVITQAVWERGKVQGIALRELYRRGLWLSDEQKKQAGLL